MGGILYIFWDGFGGSGGVVVPITDIGIEWTLPDSLMHYALAEGPQHYTLRDGLQDYTLAEEDDNE